LSVEIIVVPSVREQWLQNPQVANKECLNFHRLGFETRSWQLVACRLSHVDRNAWWGAAQQPALASLCRWTLTLIHIRLVLSGLENPGLHSDLTSNTFEMKLDIELFHHWSG
jgi:hypothetical protein